MKKLVVLALVLALSNMAGAALTLSVTGGTGTAGAVLPGDVLTISLSNDSATTLLADFGVIVAVDGAVSMDISAATAPAGVMDMTGAFPGELSALADCALPTGQASPAYNNLPTGKIIDGIKITAGAKDSTIFIRNTDEAASSTAAFTSLTLTVVPEPMTLGLLGLGGLFLRRRLA